MTPQGLRAWATVIVRDILTPGAGLFLCVWLPLSGNWSPWQLPLLAGMLGVPLVARGTAEQLPSPTPPPPDEDDVVTPLPTLPNGQGPEA